MRIKSRYFRLFSVAICARYSAGQIRYLLKGTVERAYCSEADLLGDFGDFFICFPEQRARLIDSQIIYILVEVLT